MPSVILWTHWITFTLSTFQSFCCKLLFLVRKSTSFVEGDGSIPPPRFLLMTSHIIFKFSSFWRSNLEKQTAVSEFTVHLDWTHRGRRGWVSHSHKWRWEANTHSDFGRVEICSLYGWLSTTDRLPLFLLPPLLPFFSIPIYLSSLAICIWFDHSLGGDDEHARGEESGKGGVEEVHRSLFYGTEPTLGQGLHLEIGAVGKSSQRRRQNKKSCPENQPADAHKEGDHTNMAAEALSCLCLLCILSGIFCPTSAARLGEQQHSLIKVSYFNQSKILVFLLFDHQTNWLNLIDFWQTLTSELSRMIWSVCVLGAVIGLKCDCQTDLLLCVCVMRVSSELKLTWTLGACLHCCHAPPWLIPNGNQLIMMVLKNTPERKNRDRKSTKSPTVWHGKK